MPSQACSNTISLSDMNRSKVHLFLFVVIGNYFFTLLKSKVESREPQAGIDQRESGAD